MNTRLHTPPVAVPTALVLALTLALSSFTAWAAKDRTKPTTPGNFRVTARTAYTVTVEWEPSTDKSSFNYHLSGAYHVTPAILPQTATSHTFTALYPGNEYWFFIYAKDAAGNVSGQANMSTRTLSDTTPPTTAPIVSIDEKSAPTTRISPGYPRRTTARTSPRNSI